MTLEALIIKDDGSGYEPGVMGLMVVGASVTARLH